MGRRRSINDRIEDNIEIDQNGCWVWLGWLNAHGYGQLSFRNKQCLTHRVSYEVYVGKIQEGLELDHLCRIRSCCNPGHLELVTHAENIRRGATGRHGNNSNCGSYQTIKTHCPKGHEYTKENTRVYRNHRHCRSCDIIRCRTRRQRG